MAQRTPWQSLSWQQQTRVLLFWLVMIALVMGITSSIENGRFQWRSLGGNLATELMGGVLTFFVFQYVLDKRDEDAFKSRLIREMGSRDNATTMRAVEELRAHGWLYDGSLRGANLARANLQQSQLSNANLQEANLAVVNLQQAYLDEATLQQAQLWNAKLQKAKLNRANLHQAKLRQANLQQVELRQANLHQAKLTEANLHRAELWSANLQQTGLLRANLQQAELIDANLQGADLRWAVLRDAELSKSTILPDGTHWTPETDMRRFTDPTHPDFWQPDWVKNES
ncbi:MAG: pentapeptide repeat-containing protein [Anaerolineae bacterium]|nr:pentapeptide repeat-containing protein [Anaerolineae bacterium]